MAIPMRVVLEEDQKEELVYLEAKGLLCRSLNNFRNEIEHFFTLGPDKYVYELDEYLHEESGRFYYILTPFGKWKYAMTHDDVPLTRKFQISGEFYCKIYLTKFH